MFQKESEGSTSLWAGVYHSKVDAEGCEASLPLTLWPHMGWERFNCYLHSISPPSRWTVQLALTKVAACQLQHSGHLLPDNSNDLLSFKKRFYF